LASYVGRSFEVLLLLDELAGSRGGRSAHVFGCGGVGYSIGGCCCKRLSIVRHRLWLLLRLREFRAKNATPGHPFLGNTSPSATSPSPLQERRAEWRERIAAPHTEDCPISGASRSPPRKHGGNAGVRGPHFPSARARAVGPSEPACAVSAGGASPVLSVE